MKVPSTLTKPSCRAKTAPDTPAMSPVTPMAIILWKKVGNTKALGNVLVVPDGEQRPAVSGVLHPVGNRQGEQGDDAAKDEDELLELAQEGGRLRYRDDDPLPAVDGFREPCHRGQRMKGIASVSRAKISPRSDLSRKAIVPIASPSSIEAIPATSAATHQLIPWRPKRTAIV